MEPGTPAAGIDLGVALADHWPEREETDDGHAEVLEIVQLLDRGEIRAFFYEESGKRGNLRWSVPVKEGMCRTYTISSLSEAVESLVFSDEDEDEDEDDNVDEDVDADADADADVGAEALAEAFTAELCRMGGWALRREETTERRVELITELSVGSVRRSAGSRLRHLPWKNILDVTTLGERKVHFASSLN